MRVALTIFILISAMLKAISAPARLSYPGEEGLKIDSLTRIKYSVDEKILPGKMSHSAYPVRMRVVGNAVRIQSTESQILPIYTHNKTFYLVMRLNKGINWLNGLPKGRYYINSELVTIK